MILATVALLANLINRPATTTCHYTLEYPRTVRAGTTLVVEAESNCELGSLNIGLEDTKHPNQALGDFILRNSHELFFRAHIPLSWKGRVLNHNGAYVMSPSDAFMASWGFSGPVVPHGGPFYSIRIY